MTSPNPEFLSPFRLTEATHGNGHGVGMADVIPRRMLGQLDLNAMYMNAFTSRRVVNSKIPLMAEDDLQALQVCMGYREEEAPQAARIVWIRDTARLEELLVSKALLTRVENEPLLTPEPGEYALSFDGENRLISPWA